MNLKRFLSKNAFIILVVVILGLFFVFFRKTDGFQAQCNMSYCNDTDFETITTINGQKLCLKKCNKINSSYTTATSDPTICKGMKNGKLITVSRNFSEYRKLNVNGNNSCSTGVPAKERVYLHNDSSSKSDCMASNGRYMGIFVTLNNPTRHICYHCLNTSTGGKRKPIINAQGAYICY